MLFFKMLLLTTSLVCDIIKISIRMLLSREGIFMIGNKKVIGVCLTKINDICRCDYINRLHFLSEKADCKMIVFNSFSDFYHADADDEGAKAIYGIVNFSIIDILVVIANSFHDKEMVDDIVCHARVCGKPVILVGASAEGCWSIQPDYAEAYKSIINHVIREHGARETFFIAGNNLDTDIDSNTRLALYKEALAENGIPFDEGRVAYGEYWEGPVKQLVQELVKDGRKPPQAIFCANDYMAFAACSELESNGYSVPEDVIVTGFDGVPASEYFSPQLTTCSEDTEALAELTVDIIKRASAENVVPQQRTYGYTAVFSESCGCRKVSDVTFRETALDLHYTINEMEIHEEFIYTCIDHMLKIDDMNRLYSTLSEAILENSYICLNSDFVATAIDYCKLSKQPFSDYLVVIPSKYSCSDTENPLHMCITDMVPHFMEWLNSDEAYYLTSIHVGNQVVGYYAVRTNTINKHAAKINRVVKAVTVAFNIAVNHFRQVQMKLSLDTAEMTNPLTKLPNFKGLAGWFKEFSSIEENRQMALSFSVYALPKYTYIQENYGMSDIEDAVKFISEALKIANPTNCFIAHINEDEFLVVNYYKNRDDVGDVINSATSIFFSVVEGYNSTSGKEYYVEANAGCAVVEAGWDTNLESYIKFANSEMYMNRLKYGVGIGAREEVAPKEHYKTFDMLIERNLFLYHFQPIVNAKTGDIYAYEALMRTDKSINMNPLEVLAAAKEYNRLYNVEKATMFNVMECYKLGRDNFGDRKVFINTIPGHFLNDVDRAVFLEKYGKYTSNCIFELTEQQTVSDEELDVIRNLCGGNNIAIDDYGSGHSNIVNLMRYAPQIIKIDRFLVTDIHKDQNKQMFVRTTVEFAKMNNIKVLAEGVETSNELRMVIDLGVDYIQGYYTGKPAPEIVKEISPEIKKEIIWANPLFGQDRS